MPAFFLWIGQELPAPISSCIISIVQTGASKYYTLTLAIQAANEFLYHASDCATRPMPAPLDSLDFARLADAYRSRSSHPSEVISTVLGRIAHRGNDRVWIILVRRAEHESRAAGLDKPSDATLPPHGNPYAIKDDIDLAEQPTTATCPNYATFSSERAPVRCESPSAALNYSEPPLNHELTGRGARVLSANCSAARKISNLGRWRTCVSLRAACSETGQLASG